MVNCSAIISNLFDVFFLAIINPHRFNESESKSKSHESHYNVNHKSFTRWEPLEGVKIDHWTVSTH